MNIVVNAELKATIDPLTAQEHEALERSLLADGCRDALVLWGDVLVDGHNRYDICQQHGLPFQTVQHPRLQSIADVQLWMIDQHLGRRSVSNFQRGLLALRKSDILARQHAQAMNAPSPGEGRPEPGQPGASDKAPAAASPAAPQRLQGREAIAKAARLSSQQMAMIERIQQQASPEVVAAVRSGAISINAAAALATLPAGEQVAAAAAGTDELKQAARRVRDAKRKPAEVAASGSPAPGDPDAVSIPALQQRIAELTADNLSLRRQLAALQSASAVPAPGAQDGR